MLLKTYFVEMTRYKWRKTDLLTPTAKTQIIALNNSLIEQECIECAFLFNNLYLPLGVSTKQHSLKKVRCIYKKALGKIENCLNNDFDICKMLFSMDSLVECDGQSNDKLIIPIDSETIGSESQIFFNSLTLILSIFLTSDISDMDNNYRHIKLY